MGTEPGPQSEKSADSDSTRGVRKRHRPGKPSPFGVEWSERNWDPVKGEDRRETKTEWFADEADRDKRHNELAADKRAGRLASATRQEVAEWRAFQAATEGVPWPDVVSGWRAWLAHNGMQVVAMPLVGAKAKEYLDWFAGQVDKGQLAKVTYKKVKLHIERFAQQFGHITIDKVTGEEIEDWLDDLEDVASDATFNTYLKDVRAFFARCVKARLLRFNPGDDVEERDDLSDFTGVLTIEETARLLLTARDHHDPRHGHRFRLIFPRIAIEIFGGLRTSSAQRLVKDDINFADKGITLPKRKLKTKRRHYISGYPDPLWAWLKHAEERAWEPVDAREYRYLKSELFTAAGVPHPKNCLRHGFASYMTAHLKDMGKVAYLLCHRGKDSLLDHYLGRVTEAEGKRFVTLLPAVAARLAKTPPQPAPETPAAATPPAPA